MDFDLPCLDNKTLNPFAFLIFKYDKNRQSIRLKIMIIPNRDCIYDNLYPKSGMFVWGYYWPSRYGKSLKMYGNHYPTIIRLNWMYFK